MPLLQSKGIIDSYVFGDPALRYSVHKKQRPCSFSLTAEQIPLMEAAKNLGGLSLLRYRLVHRNRSACVCSGEAHTLSFFLLYPFHTEIEGAETEGVCTECGFKVLER